MNEARMLPDAGNQGPTSVEIVLRLNGADVPVRLDDQALARIASAVAQHGTQPRPEPLSPYLTIPEAAEYLRCSRQRVDDLLSQRRLTRVKEGARTLIRRDEVDAHLTTEGRFR